MSTPLHFVILAAGKGTRMKSELPKVLHAVGGEPMIVRILRTASHFSAGHVDRRGRPHGRQGPRRPGRVPGRRDRRPGAAARDRPRPAPGRAAAGRPDRDGRPALRRRADALGRVHPPAAGAPSGDRRGGHGPHRAPAQPGRPGPHRARERAASPGSSRSATRRQPRRRSTEFNSGIYAFALDGLFDALRRIGTANDQGEYYLTDLLGIFLADGRGVETFTIDDADELRGVNSRAELAIMNAQVRDARNEARDGVGRDAGRSVVGVDRAGRRDRAGHRRSTPTSTWKGGRASARNCEIHAGVRVINSTIGDGTVVQNYCVVRDSSIEQQRGDGAVLAHPAGQPRRRRRAHRQLRRAEEDAPRRRAPRRTTWPTSATRSSARR